MSARPRLSKRGASGVRCSCSNPIGAARYKISAPHAHDATAEAAARERLTELDAHETELRTRVEAALGEADERIRKARLPVQETMLVLPTEPGPDPPSK